MWDVLSAIGDVVDVLTHPRFYVPLLAGVAIALALWQWMRAGDTRDLLQRMAVLTGLALGVYWDRSR